MDDQKKDQRMAFTIGRTSCYDRSLPATKLGHRPDYPGGWVWQTADEAKAFLRDDLQRQVPGWDPATFSVYVLELPTSWWADVGGIGPDGVHHLLNDARVVGKVP